MGCGTYGHWYNDHKEYQSLPGHILSSDGTLPPISDVSPVAPAPAAQVKPEIPPVIQQNNWADNFNMEFTPASADAPPPSFKLGPMVENGALTKP